MANACNNTLSVKGEASEIRKYLEWVHSFPLNGRSNIEIESNQIYDALKELEEQANSDDGIGQVGSGRANRAYGHADLQVSSDELTLMWESRWSPSLDAVLQMARNYPNLAFHLIYSEPGEGLGGFLKCAHGAPTFYAGGHDDSSDDSDAYSEDYDSE